jgi:HEPN domain-containing protein
MNSVNDPLAWVAKAEEDYLVARSALRRRKPFTYTACFHAQQCAEKYLKGLLVARGSKFSKVHDLLKLSQECEKAGILLTIDLTQLDRLSLYAIQTRYPGVTPTLADARDAVGIAKTVRAFARKLLGVKPQEKKRRH